MGKYDLNQIKIKKEFNWGVYSNCSLTPPILGLKKL